MIGYFKIAAVCALAFASVDAMSFEAAMKSGITSTRKDKQVANLVSKARPTKNSRLHRGLNQEAEIDLTGYSVKFDQCQFVKAYNDELADNEESETVLATQRFVIFRLCSSCSSCEYQYGEYIVPLDDYLENVVEYLKEEQEEMCNACEECGQGDDADADGDGDGDNERRRRRLVDCDSCYEECQKIQNMEENGYVDATEFVQCNRVYEPEDDAGEELYAGPICSGSGTKIKIGVFKDEECSVPASNKDVEDYLVDGDGNGAKLSHALLKSTYSSDSCIPCLKENEDADDGAEPEENELCKELFENAGKCESPHGFSTGYEQLEDMYNQYVQEETVCNFISSLHAGTYAEDGEIVVSGANARAGGSSGTTGGQKFALAFFILGTVGLAVYAAMLHSQLTKGSKAGLSRQGGAMA